MGKRIREDAVKEEEDTTVVVEDDATAKQKKQKKHKKSKGEEENTTKEVGDVQMNGENDNGDDGKDKKKKNKDKKKSKKGTAEDDTDTTTTPTTTTKMTKEQMKAFRKELNLTVDGEDESTNSVFPPLMSFADATFPQSVLACCSKFTKPTPIQSQSWPIALQGRDVIGIASTGSGKTLAFTLPGLTNIISTTNNNKSKKSNSRVSILVLAPTRELATQIHEVMADAASTVPDNTNNQKIGLGVACIYGGVSKDLQRKQLTNARAVVATPGRLLDLVQEGCCDLGAVSYLVLDEADRMLDMGFEKDVRKILSLLPEKRQTMMFSATWPTSIQALAHEFLSKPIRITVGSADLSASHSVTQIVEVLAQQDPRTKEMRLNQMLSKYHKSRSNRVLVFCLYKKEAARVETFLREKGWSVVGIHGDMSQAERNRAFQAFRDGKIPLLVATDVAARGLDIPDVEYVINLTFPLTIEDYVHRIGRTGRAGKTGTAHTLFTVADKAHAGALVNILNESNQPVPEELLKFGTGVKRKEHKMYGAHFRSDGDESEATSTKAATKITFDDDSD